MVAFDVGNIVNSVIRFYRLTRYLQVLPTTHWNSSSAMIAITTVRVKKYSFNLLQLPCNATTTIHASWAANILCKSQPEELLCHCDMLIKSEKQKSDVDQNLLSTACENSLLDVVDQSQPQILIHLLILETNSCNLHFLPSDFE